MGRGRRGWHQYIPLLIAVLLGFLTLCFDPVLAVPTTTVSGSGFIITQDGYILTNYHVVKDATEIKVYMDDGAIYEAMVVDYSSTWGEGGNDVALLKVEARNLPTLLLADSDDVQLYDEVIAMGFPLSFELGDAINVTGGHITSFRDFENTPKLFQIDAAINPGNSGGPLLNVSGQVIGIPTAIYTRQQDKEEDRDQAKPTLQGLNFAVPINYARELVIRNIAGWVEGTLDSLSASPQETVRQAAPAVVYILVSRRVPVLQLIPEKILGDPTEVNGRSWFMLHPLPFLEEAGLHVEERVYALVSRSLEEQLTRKGDFASMLFLYRLRDSEEARRAVEILRDPFAVMAAVSSDKIVVVSKEWDDTGHYFIGQEGTKGESHTIVRILMHEEQEIGGYKIWVTARAHVKFTSMYSGNYPGIVQFNKSPFGLSCVSVRRSMRASASFNVGDLLYVLMFHLTQHKLGDAECIRLGAKPVDMWADAEGQLVVDYEPMDLGEPYETGMYLSEVENTFRLVLKEVLGCPP